jgi:hypothetical protein
MNLIDRGMTVCPTGLYKGLPMYNLEVADEEPGEWFDQYKGYDDPWVSYVQSLVQKEQSLTHKPFRLLLTGYDPLKYLHQSIYMMSNIRRGTCIPIQLHIHTSGRYKFNIAKDNIHILCRLETNYHWMVHPALVYEELVYMVGYELHPLDIGSVDDKPIWLQPYQCDDKETEVRYYERAIELVKQTNQNVRLDV